MKFIYTVLISAFIGAPILLTALEAQINGVEFIEDLRIEYGPTHL